MKKNQLIGGIAAVVFVGAVIAFKLFNMNVAPEQEDQLVLVKIKLSQEMGTEAEQERFFEVEEKISKAVSQSGKGEFDGNEIGGGYWDLYMYTPDANALFSVVEPVLRVEKLPTGSYAIKRYGKPGSQEEKIELGS